MLNYHSDTEPALPKRDPADAKCSNPHCTTTVRVRGEFCRACLQVQDRHRALVRANWQRKQAS